MNEAMGLATMNPMVGTTYKPFSAIMMVDNYNHDKDINDGWSTYRVARTLDKDSQYIEVDDNGKLTNRDTWDTLSEADLKLYDIKTFNINSVFNSLLEELRLPYEDRPVHDKDYLYEAFIGSKVYMNDQVDYEPLLEEIELKKLSKIINSDADNISKDADKEFGTMSPTNSDETHVNGTTLLASSKIQMVGMNSLFESYSVSDIEGEMNKINHMIEKLQNRGLDMGFFNSSNSNIQRYSQDQDRSFKYNEIKRWVEVHGGAIIKDHYATEEELEEDWYKYKSLPRLWYRANDEAMKLFGKDNETLYYENKQRFMRNNSVSGLESEFNGIKDVGNNVLDRIKARFRYIKEPGIELEKDYYLTEEKKKRDGILVAPNLSSKDENIERIYSPVLKEDGSDISDEEKLRQVKNYTDNDYPILRKEYDNLTDLENDWFKYNSNDRDRRKNCDDFSMSIYGKTVTDIYNDNLNRLLNKEDMSDNVMPMEYKPSSIDEECSDSLLYEEALFRAVSETDDYAYLANMKYRLLEDDNITPVKYIYRGKILDRINYKLDYDVPTFIKLRSTSMDIPILNPDEIARFGNSENTTYAPSDFAIKWFNNYNGIMNGIQLSYNPVSWVTEVTTLSNAYDVEEDPEEKERLAANLMFLGWNPRFSYNTYYRRVANERINKYLSDRSVCNYIPIYSMPVFKHDAFIESTELKEECPAVYFIFHDDLKVGEPGFFISFDGFKDNMGYLNIFNNIGSEYSSYKDKEDITKYLKNDDFIMAFAVPLLVEDFNKVKANFESYLMNTSLNTDKTLKEGTEAKALIDIYPRRIMSDFMKLFLDSSFDFNTSLDLDEVMKYLEDTKGKEFDAYIIANTIMVNFDLQKSMKATKLNFNDLKSISIKENYIFTEDNIDCYPYLCLSEYGRIKNTKSKPKKDKKILKEFFDLLNNKIIDI